MGIEGFVGRHRAQSRFSDPSRFAGLLAPLPTEPADLSAAARNVIVHYRASGHALPEETRDDIHLRWVQCLLQTDQRCHQAPLTVPRDVTARAQGCCRDHALLCVAALRAHDIPARSRAMSSRRVDGQDARPVQTIRGSPVNTQQIAEAFSSYRFDEVYDRLDELITWVVLGQEPIEGKVAVITTCTGAAAEFSGMASALLDRFVSVGNDSTAAVDAIGRYEDQDGSVSVVSSADIYEFSAQGQVVRITSYAVEL